MIMRLCGGAGCQTAIPEDARYCPACTAERAPKQSDDGIRSNSVSDRERYAFLYKSERWKRQVQPKALKVCPMCSRCGIKVSELVDHIVPAGVAIAQAQASGLYPLSKYAGFYFTTNLTGLCRGCHWHKTNEDKRHIGDWPDVVGPERAKPKKVWSF
jgi:5-methylcytosine-specific restriction endonuclease McrA